MPNPWVTGHIIQPQYLNSVQELLSDWADNVLLQASQAAVVIPGSASAPAELVVDGYMKSNESETLLDLTGQPSAIYNVYATANRAVDEWAIDGSPTQVVAPHTRKIGEADFDGTEIVEVRSEIREINVSHLLGHQGSETPAPQAIPAGRADASLDPGWLVDPQLNMVPIGGIREAWVPSGVGYEVATGWIELNGQVVAAASHTFPGVATFTAPDMRNKLSLGADAAAIYGTPGEAPNSINPGGVAPGLNGQSGTNEERERDHTHGGGDHTHTLAAHDHDASHRHWFGSHRHIYGTTFQPWSKSGALGLTTLISSFPEVWGTRREVTITGLESATQIQFDGTPSHVVTNQAVFRTDIRAAQTISGATQLSVASSSDGTADINPRTVGVSVYMRVM